MLNRLPEKHMHGIKWLLAIGWLTLIASLIYDPLSPILTDPNSLFSPFKLPAPDQLVDQAAPSLGVDWQSFQRFTADPSVCVMVQGKCVEEQPYGMAARIFWAVIVPIGLVIIHIFGHELWRRICPLSFFSQIPRALGIQRKRKVKSETGKDRMELVVVDKESWLGKNYLYLQFGLFFLGLNIRILFVNSDRLALAIFLLFTIGAAMTVGYLFAGKSWCQYFCPMAPVQMVYTGPRGLLDSYSHLGHRLGISQSMCREVDKKTGEEKSACVSCQSPCIDIDSERSYWDKITAHDQKLLYYGYVGLVISFYFYYFLYAGSWSYYYSGAWTHEETQISHLFSPGFYINGQTIPIPKIIACPLTLGVFCAGTYFIGELGERLYKFILRKTGKQLTLSQLRHNMFTLSTVIAWNIFWSFGSRPNLALLPPVIERLITGFLVICSGLWLYQTWGRSEEQYQREGLANNLRRQLDKLGFDMAKFLNRPVQELKPDEVFVLAKVLPAVDKEQRLKAYRGVLQEALEDGRTSSSGSLSLLQDLRQELGIEISEHYNLLTELGIQDTSLLDPDRQSGIERQLRLNAYHRNLEFLIMDVVERGTPVREAIRHKSKQIAALKEEYRIDEKEDEEILERIVGQESGLVKNAESLLWQYLDMGISDQALRNLPDNPNDPVYRLLRVLNSERAKILIVKLLSILEVLGNGPEAHRLASNISNWSPTIVREVLNSKEGAIPWHDRLSRSVIAALEKGSAAGSSIQAAMEAESKPGEEDTQGRAKNTLKNGIEADKTMVAAKQPSGSHQTMVRQAGSTSKETSLMPLLKGFAKDNDPLFQAASLYAMGMVHPEQAVYEAEKLSSTAYDSPILLEIIQMLQSRKSPRAMPQGMVTTLQAVLQIRGEQRTIVLQKPVIQVGSAASNDIVIKDSRVSAHHFTLFLNDYGLSVRELGNPTGIFVGSREIRNTRDYLTPGDVIRFTLSDDISLKVNWSMMQVDTQELGGCQTTLEKLLYLQQSHLFNSIQISTLVELARLTTCHSYAQGTILCEAGEPSDRVMIVTEGEAEVRVISAQNTQEVVGMVRSGETIGELGVLTQSPRTATVVAKSEVVRTLNLESKHLKNFIAKDSILANGLLVMVSRRLQDTLSLVTQ